MGANKVKKKVTALVHFVSFYNDFHTKQAVDSIFYVP
jgi:hypothetical protein